MEGLNKELIEQLVNAVVASVSAHLESRMQTITLDIKETIQVQGSMQKSIDRMKESFDTIEQSLDSMKESLHKIDQSVDRTNESLDKIDQSVGESRKLLDDIKVLAVDIESQVGNCYCNC